MLNEDPPLKSRPAALARSVVRRLRARGHAESLRIVAYLRRRILFLLVFWAILALVGGFLRLSLLAASTPQAIVQGSFTAYMLPYLAIAVAPAIGWYLVKHAYPEGSTPQPSVRLAQIGSWQDLPAEQARSRTGYGMAGFLVSLCLGLLVSMVMRLSQFLLAIPLMPPQAPPWGFALFRIMTFDLVLLSFMYFVCFAMALRKAPLFPRMLLLTWLYDLMMQIVIAREVAEAGNLPGIIAAPLQQLLIDNVHKVLISMLIWLPYLIMSRRVNLTFRHRVSAGQGPA
jgi:hypothetical protein